MRLIAGLCAVSVALAAAGPTPALAKKDSGKVAAGIVGGLIVGSALTSALSPRQKVIERVYVQPPPPPPPPEPTFSPAPGVLCYASQRACYNMAGGYNPSWTWQVYAR